MMGMFLVARLALSVARHLVPVHARHHDVEEDEVGRVVRHHGERFLAAGRGREVKAFGREHDFQQLSVVAIIVHDQKARGVVSGHRAGDSCSGKLCRDGREKILVAHRLGDVAITPRGANALLVTLHRQCGEGDHRNRARRVRPLEQRGGFETVHPGSWMSIKIRFGCSSRASVNPASASSARSTVWPADCSRKAASVMLAGLSSTTSTLAMSGGRVAVRHGPAFPHRDRATQGGPRGGTSSGRRNSRPVQCVMLATAPRPRRC